MQISLNLDQIEQLVVLTLDEIEELKEIIIGSGTMDAIGFIDEIVKKQRNGKE